MNQVKKYLVYARAPFLTASAVPAVYGTALAWSLARRFNFVDFLLVLFGLMFAHLGVNLANDYYDFVQGADQKNRFRNPFSGGSPHLVEGKENPRVIFLLAWMSLGLGFLCGVLLMIRIDRGIGPVFWFMLAGFISGYFYTAPPLKFAYRGWGELFVFLGFGLLPVCATFYVMAGEVPLSAVIASAPVGLLITNVLWINQFPDYESDREAGKRTLVVRMGTARARLLYLVFLLAAGIFILLMPRFGTSYFAYLGLLGLVPATAAARVLMQNYENPPRLVKGQALTIISHLATGALLTIGLLL